MGYYIDPSNMSKEAWLSQNGFRVDGPTGDPAPGHHMVCLVDNGYFTAAGIAYDQEERERFSGIDDRPKTWYVVSDDKLIEVEPNVKELLRSAG